MFSIQKLVLALAFIFVGSSAVAQACPPNTRLVCTTQGNQTICECRINSPWGQ